MGAFDAFDEAIANRAGAAAHITKPFEPRALVELVTSTAPQASRSGKSATEARLAKPPEPVTPEPTKMVKSVEPVQVVETPAPPMTSDKPAEKEIQRAVESTPEPTVMADSGDLLGLAHLFPPEVASGRGNVAADLTDEEIDRIADRVIRKLSAQAVESIAWDVVPDIAVKILREELKKTNS